jgi:glycosyltransferase involved in cell wall biosynthesis
MKVAVVTPTIGTPYLSQCIDSVQDQTYENLTHYIFLDGEEHFQKVYPQAINKTKKTIKSIGLQENIGKGWYGHRVYAACSFLVNADIICYLDEDNWFEKDHVEKLVKTITEKKLDWAFSFRKIYDKQGNYLCEDNCESLGKWPIYFSEDQHHIDTSSFAVKQSVAVNIGHAWYGQWGADRKFFYNLSKYFPNYDCSLAHTLCYRLDGNPNSVNKEFFDKGNEINFERYNGKLPWKQKSEPPSLLVAPGISVQF